MAIRPRGKAKRTPRPTLKPKGVGSFDVVAYDTTKTKKIKTWTRAS